MTEVIQNINVEESGISMSCERPKVSSFSRTPCVHVVHERTDVLRLIKAVDQRCEEL